ncbi:MAG: hypothetical protein AB7O68_21540 [Pirellulales bacterium]
MARPLTSTEHDRLRRELRSQIAASRLRLERDVQQLRSTSRELTSWQTYVRRYPVPILLASFGVGIALAAGVSRRSVRRVVGRRLMSAALGVVGARLWREVLAIFVPAAP